MPAGLAWDAIINSSIRLAILAEEEDAFSLVEETTTCDNSHSSAAANVIVRGKETFL
jgi:hypothetical protein